MESRRTLLFSFFCLFSLLSGPSAFASPVDYTSLGRRIAAEVVSSLALRREPLDLHRRDVIAPKITSPTASSVWPVGSNQTVTWDTSNFPPDDQITNPIGRVILGFDSGDSLNLDFDHPLAQGFKLRDGQVSVVVPDVPPGDYLIVLMGDSGNASPSFAITSISGGTPSSSSSSSGTTSTVTTATLAGIVPSPTITGSVAGTAIGTPLPSVLSSTLNTDPIPLTGTTITGGNPTASTGFPSITGTNLPQTTETSAASLSSQTNAASRRAGPCWTLAAGLLVVGMISL